MKVKLFVVTVIIVLVICVIGLGVLIQKNYTDTQGASKEGENLEIVGSDGSNLPSGLPTAKPTDEPKKITNNNSADVLAENSAKSPNMTINQSKKYSAVLETSEGNITIAFHTKQTPITVNNFISLAKKDFYDDTIFHRVIKGFMIQGGDPRGDGTGGPGYTFADEEFDGDYLRGTVAMANSGPDTNGSQFFIMHEDNPLPKNYVIFGEVTKGMDVVDAIANAPVTASRSGEQSKPVDPVKILNVSIIEE